MPYSMRAGAHVVLAESIEELAELVECALEAGDEIAWPRAGGGRLLADEEFGQLLELAASPPR